MFWGVGLVLGAWMVFGSVVCSRKCGLFWEVWFVLGSVVCSGKCGWFWGVESKAPGTGTTAQDIIVCEQMS